MFKLFCWWVWAPKLCFLRFLQVFLGFRNTGSPWFCIRGLQSSQNHEKMMKHRVCAPNHRNNLKKWWSTGLWARNHRENLKTHMMKHRVFEAIGFKTLCFIICFDCFLCFFLFKCLCFSRFLQTWTVKSVVVLHLKHEFSKFPHEIKTFQ